MVAVSVILCRQLSAHKQNCSSARTHILLFRRGTVISIVIVSVIHWVLESTLGILSIHRWSPNASFKVMSLTYWKPNPRSFVSRYAPR